VRAPRDRALPRSRAMGHGLAASEPEAAHARRRPARRLRAAHRAHRRAAVAAAGAQPDAAVLARRGCTHMRSLTRRQTLLAAIAIASGAGVRAQAFPSKPVRIIVGYSAGGAVDIIARAIGQHLQAALGQPVIVDNRPGAGTNIATKSLIDSAPDGHTLMLAANALAANVSLFQPAPYALDRITPIALV